ncbi:MAG: hypothetical protein ABI837_01120 [Acidobacteriota bacterium]
MPGKGFRDIELLRRTLEASVIGDVEIVTAICNDCGTAVRATRSGQGGIPGTFCALGVNIQLTCGRCSQRATFATL